MTLLADIESFAYRPGEAPVLADIHLTVSPGELVVLAGPSGSGKSTLACALAGLIPQRLEGEFHGSVRRLTEEGGVVELTALPLHEAAQHVGIIFQNPEYQLIQYQVSAEVAFGPENLGLPHREVVERVRDALAAVGAEDLASQGIGSLSGGQKQRVAIAAALAMAPPMLVLDEPTSDLDPLATGEVLALLRRLSRERGQGIVIVEHKLDEVAPLADRILLIQGGRVTLDDRPQQAFSDTARWWAAGVRPPELACLAGMLPERFAGQVPLTVEEAHAALAPSVDCLPVLPEPAGESSGKTAAGSPGIQPAALELCGVSVSFGDRAALRDVSLRIGRGEWVALIGANGSGKTTLGAILMGFNAPQEGTASCFGRPVEAGRIPRQAQRLGYLFQNVDDMLFGQSVAAELEFTARHRVPCGPGAPTAGEVAAVTGLEGRLHAHPYTLSGGERQRLALGALLTRAPQGLILDEPTTGLDEAHAGALLELLARLRSARGSLTCLLITHDMRLVARIADRVVVMRAGTIVLDDTPRRVFAQAPLLESCGLRPPGIAALHRRLAGGALTQAAMSAPELAALVCSAQRTGAGALR